MPSRLTYSQLASLLIDLGFERRVVRGSHVLFTHQETETLVMLPLGRPSEKVPMANVVSTRFLVDAKGIANQEKWQRLVEKHAKGH